MKNRTFVTAALTISFCATLSLASSRLSTGFSLNDSTDGGGQHAASASYAVDGSIGGFGGISTAGSDTAKHGYIGQLTEVGSVTVTGTPAQVNEAAASHLSGTATMDDATITPLAGSDVAWGSVTYPFQSLDSNGVLTAVANVYACPIGTVTGAYLGIAGSTSVQVLGPYATSGIPDAWLIQYFGAPPNPLAAPTADATGTGQNNLFKYIAGLNPTNPASVFSLRIASVEPNRQDLIFSPRMAGRTYQLQFSTNLLIGAFAAVSSSITNDVGAQRTVTDLQATNASRFYRVQISNP